jgi:hypothetical protein
VEVGNAQDFDSLTVMVRSFRIGWSEPSCSPLEANDTVLPGFPGDSLTPVHGM